MSRTKAQRLTRLLPEGVPRYVRVYKQRGCFSEKWAVEYTGKYLAKTGGRRWLLMFTEPGGYVRTVELWKYERPPGQRVEWKALPELGQRVVRMQYCFLWDIDLTDLQSG